MTELTTTGNTQIVPASQVKGVDINSKWFRNVKPATLTLVQKSSTVPEDIKVGHLYIRDFNRQFKEMRCVLLHDPSEQRQYYIGNKGELNKKPENLACFSYDLIRPNPNAKLPQSMLCANCDKGDWGPFNAYKAEHGTKNRDLIPPCEKSISLSLLDTTLKMPLRMFVGSTQKNSFEDGMENIARLILMKKAEGFDPNIYDVSFKLSTKIVQNGAYTSYVPTFTDARYLTPEEKAEFGIAFELFTKQHVEEPKEEETIQKQSEAIDNAVVEGEYLNDAGEIKI